MVTTQRRRSADNPKVIDFRLSLSWLLGASGTLISVLCGLIWTIASQSSKLDQVVISNAKVEKRLDERDIRSDVFKEGLFNLQRANDGLTIRVGELERVVRTLKIK